jgi:hypothetical protein
VSDWQVGDLAVCVDDAPCPCGHRMPTVLGRTYNVSEIHANPDGALCLSFKGVCDRMPRHYPGINGNRFRKIRPDEHEDCEPEFVELLKRSRVKA